MATHYGFLRPWPRCLCGRQGVYVDYITTDKDRITCETCLKIMKRKGMIQKTMGVKRLTPTLDNPEVER